MMERSPSEVGSLRRGSSEPDGRGGESTPSRVVRIERFNSIALKIDGLPGGRTYWSDATLDALKRAIADFERTTSDPEAAVRNGGA